MSILITVCLNNTVAMLNTDVTEPAKSATVGCGLYGSTTFGCGFGFVSRSKPF